MEGGP